MNPFKNRWIQVIPGVAVLATAFYLGHLTGTGTPHENTRHEPGARVEKEAPPQVWTCSMHPRIRQPKEGLCPICAMDLIPVRADAGGGQNPRELTLTAAARKLAGVRTAPVQRRFAEHVVRMIGKVTYDQTRLGTITAWVPGRIDRLFANYTGVPVQKGEHLVSLYSPELLSAQTELIQALSTADSFEGSGLDSMRKTAAATVEAVRGKLRLWGLTQEQVAEIEERGTPADHLTITAPTGGIVVALNVSEGMYVQTGTPLGTIADLQQVWIKLEAYESDLAWLRYGQEVTFTAQAYPGETFEGRIAVIDPVLAENTRTAGVRVNVDNGAGRLMPGMFVRAEVWARMGAAGRILDLDLAGKWISPMHPEVVKDGPGFCDVCGMPLVPAETLGYADPGADTATAPLLIPASAPLITGRRALVYTAVPGNEGVFEGREVVLGPRAGDDYIVVSGLQEEEQVVVEGNFKIDSAIQILAGTSMMNPPQEEEGTTVPQRIVVPAEFLARLDAVYEAYFEAHLGLSLDDLAAAKKGADRVPVALELVDGVSLRGATARKAWAQDREAILEACAIIAQAGEILAAREAFSLLSETLIAATRRFGASGDQPLLLYHCPMAFDWRGANWMQNREGVENPYFGDAMYRCGELKEAFVDLRPADRDGEDEP